MLFLLLLLQVSLAYDYFVVKSQHSYRREYKKSNLNQTFFSSLDSYQVNAVPATEDEYPWIARVVHSRSSDTPHVCTASCIHQGIFITTARCINGLKVHFTTVIYKYQRLPVRAFVIPSNGTKQSFDDIGFIVVQAVTVPWGTVQLFRETNRTDDDFQWFHNFISSKYKVVGYATEKGIHTIKATHRQYNLTELDIIIGTDICADILTFHHKYEGFQVPCYHSCTLQEFRNRDEKCKNYHGVEGGAILDVKENRLLGVATWGPYFAKYELPVGFSVVNSRNFFQDYECAKQIWTAFDKVSIGYYQNLCNSAK